MARYYADISLGIEHANEATGNTDNDSSNLSDWEVLTPYPRLKELKKWAYEGELSSHCLRSVAWRIFLNIYPEDSCLWKEINKKKRQEYESLKRKFKVNPGSGDKSLDPTMNNPLSQCEESPWNQYFEDSELRDQIRLDVKRTFPEVEFFQSSKIQDLMVSVLFCYARKYYDLSYLQGMHEILAPLVFVLTYDQRIYKNLSKEKSSSMSDLNNDLIDENYLEHDAYIMFEVVMEKLHCWYEKGDSNGAFTSSQSKIVPEAPFARPQDIGPTAEIVRRLTAIHDQLLKRLQPEVYSVLSRLEISPQLYGIRWVRLLFGREFSFGELLSVWDVIFADSGEEFELVPYFIVAMLSALKSQLLQCDYVSALNLLMRFSSPFDVQHIIRLALYYKDPKVHKLPIYSSNYSTSTSEDTNSRSSRVGSARLQGVVHHSSSLARSSSLPRSSGGSRLHISSGPSSLSNVRGDGNEGVILRTGDNPTAKIVSGLTRIGEKLVKPNTSSQISNIVKDRPMSDMSHSVVPSSLALPNDASKSLKNKPLTNEFVSAQVESASVTASNVASRLSSAHESLSTRLSQFRIQFDPEVDEAMEQISEVIEVLHALGKVLQSHPSVELNVSSNHSEILFHPLMESPDS